MLDPLPWFDTFQGGQRASDRDVALDIRGLFSAPNACASRLPGPRLAIASIFVLRPSTADRRTPSTQSRGGNMKSLATLVTIVLLLAVLPTINGQSVTG